ncbi:hypothetical protein Csa_012619 [Cucumis sativus]|uniref:Transmembrane protein n=1 Tax=Cucumis sativus TaxID=3659 RepID=A0A0A0KZ46_CUCSA|nr:hypothetical protein Csa_012619 [Cucumis sativus]
MISNHREKRRHYCFGPNYLTLILPSLFLPFLTEISFPLSIAFFSSSPFSLSFPFSAFLSTSLSSSFNPSPLFLLLPDSSPPRLHVFRRFSGVNRQRRS